MHSFHKYWLLILLWPALTFATDLPDMGTSSSALVSSTTEKALGEAIMRKLQRQLDIIEDVEINNYFATIGKRLVSFSDQPDQPFHFFVVNSDKVNAFAMPGGFIGIHSGLILNTQDESELAAVLAHEIAHVTQRHLARTFEAMDKLSLPIAVATIVAIVASVATQNPDIGQAAVATMAAGGRQMYTHFTHTHEKEADRIGIQLLAKAGFDPLSMPSFFETLQSRTRYYRQGIPEFLRTHPITIDRIAEAKERAQRYPRKPLVSAPSYQLMRARLRVLVEMDRLQLIKQLKRQLAEGRYRNELATRYALTLALLMEDQTEGVQTQIDWLFTHDGDRVVYRLQQAHLALLQTQVDKAMQHYEQALQIYPNNVLLSLDYAEKLLQNNNPKRAKVVLSTLSTQPNAHYYQLLAQSYQLLGNKAEAHLALAEAFYLQGQTVLALGQLKQARQLETTDFYVAARIESRYQALQAILETEQITSASTHP